MESNKMIYQIKAYRSFLNEHATNNIPITSILTLRFDKTIYKTQMDVIDPNKYPYDDKLLIHICYAHQDAINKYFYLITKNNAELIVLVLESDIYQNNKYVMINIRIQFPYAHISYVYYQNLIYPHIIKYLNDNNILGLLKVSPIDDWQSIIAKDLIIDQTKFPIKYQNCDRLKLTHIWNQVNCDTCPNELHFNDVFILNNHQSIYRKEVDPLTVNVSFENQLSLFLSNQYWPIFLIPKTLLV